MNRPSASPTFVIRPFDKGRDYEARAAILNLTFPEHPVTVEELRHSDSKQNPDPRYLSRRYVLEIGGRSPDAGTIAAYFWYGHRPWSYHPRKLDFELAVHPEYRRRGIGTAAYEEIIGGIEELDPLQLSTGIFEHQSDGLSFLEHRGFEETMRFWASYLDVESFSFERRDEALSRVAANGIDILTEVELSADPEFERKLYEMYVEVVQDVPTPNKVTPEPFERFVEMRRDSINRIPEAFFVAVHTASGEYAGSTALWRVKAADFLQTGLTGVRRGYRRMGIALALKLRSIEFAQKGGFPEIKTDNESGNAGMLKINDMLGYERRAVGIDFRKNMQTK